MQYLLLISADEETAVTRMREGAFASFDTWITDLDEAVAIAAAHPAAAFGQVEVRPVRVS